MVMIEVTNSELWDMFRNGSTNQKVFIENLTFSEFEEVIDLLENEYECDIRGDINGGGISIVDKENEYTVLKLDDNKFLEIQ